MTDHSDDRRDELASAHLDGLTTRAEAQRVASDPDLQQRVEALRSARAAMRAEGVSVDPERRERAIAAALAAFAEEPSDREGAPAGAVDTLATRRAERAARAASASRVDRSARTRQILGVAAAVLVLALSVPVLGSLGSDGADDAEDLATAVADDADGEAGTESASDADESGAGADASADTFADDEARSGAATGGQGVTPVAGAVADLGAFASYADLEDAVVAVLAPAAGGPSVGTSSNTRTESSPAPPVTDPLGAARQACAAAAADAATADGAIVVFQAAATLEGRPVAVTVVEGPDATRTLTATDVTHECDLVGTGKLPPG